MTTEPKPWWRTSVSEELTIMALAVIAIGAMLILGVESKEAVSAIGGGLVGYLAKAPV